MYYIYIQFFYATYTEASITSNKKKYTNNNTSIYFPYIEHIDNKLFLQKKVQNTIKNTYLQSLQSFLLLQKKNNKSRKRKIKDTNL